MIIDYSDLSKKLCLTPSHKEDLFSINQDSFQVLCNKTQTGEREMRERKREGKREREKMQTENSMTEKNISDVK